MGGRKRKKVPGFEIDFDDVFAVPTSSVVSPEVVAVEEVIADPEVITRQEVIIPRRRRLLCLFLRQEPWLSSCSSWRTA